METSIFHMPDSLSSWNICLETADTSLLPVWFTHLTDGRLRVVGGALWQTPKDVESSFAGGLKGLELPFAVK